VPSSTCSNLTNNPYCDNSHLVRVVPFLFPSGANSKKVVSRHDSEIQLPVDVYRHWMLAFDPLFRVQGLGHWMLAFHPLFPPLVQTSHGIRNIDINLIISAFGSLGRIRSLHPAPRRAQFWVRRQCKMTQSASAKPAGQARRMRSYSCQSRCQAMCSRRQGQEKRQEHMFSLKSIAPHVLCNSQ
jgi:hypothetical protein